MLTQEDLQAIQIIVRSEVQNEVQKEVRKEVRSELKKGLRPIIKRITKIERDLVTAIRLFDNDHHELEGRVTLLEQTVYG